jgi:hypothetical protein
MYFYASLVSVCELITREIMTSLLQGRIKCLAGHNNRRNAIGISGVG